MWAVSGHSSVGRAGGTRPRGRATARNAGAGERTRRGRSGRRRRHPDCIGVADARRSRVMEKRIIDVWMQHPSKAFLAEPMFDSLRRWAHGGLPEGDIPLGATIAAMDEAGVGVGLLAAWWGPKGPLISNDDVAACVRRYPERLVGVSSVNFHWPREAGGEARHLR